MFSNLLFAALLSVVVVASALPIYDDEVGPYLSKIGSLLFPDLICDIQLTCIFLKAPMDYVQDLVLKARHKREALTEMLRVIGSMFTRADADSDGVLDRQEFWGTYRAFDNDHDGTITALEYLDAVSRMPGISAFGNSHEVGRICRLLFMAGDMDHNRVLDEDDATIIFFNLDKDHDKAISKAEYMARWQEVMARIGM
ncbi:hypothetical protein CAPTEDRAFT_229153 [Capitella teleta]|uniref:EF-hand domain-containing protein n=1 Tax=Capitella teleta TaxID=283909 RepID=R7UYC5_CAPTE|nr:hypothetical protein CAPTEDRAFT_229153 [Capitella teleta]|eukprot:ELU08431.1 hypothetical protein CAPTEDRAFT_229153 [Capitella teleta]